MKFFLYIIIDSREFKISFYYFIIIVSNASVLGSNRVMSKLILVGKKNGLKRYINKDVESLKPNEEAKKAVEETKNDDDLTKIAKRKLIEDAKRINEVSDQIGISAAVKKPKLENKTFLANVVRQAHFSNESKRVKNLNKRKSNNI